MNSQKAKSIFLHAIEHIAPDRWPSYLNDACGEDESLRNDVEELLSSHRDDVDFAQEAREVCERDFPTDIRPITEQPGDTIGPYKLLQQIGEGGMGVVYMAEQTEPVERRVALKIIKPGMDTRQVIARFEAERQALAMMDHPNIAKVLDAGTTETGRPYFVMELVKGIPITSYCDDQHLTPKERLKLFIPICQAVQHAHQKGIIHRDLKPSNILVAQYDGKPVPKVIDFGVAKAVSHKLTEKTMFTHYGQIVGTVDYMSPEQAQFNQLDVDTRSDVYSLGVLLYELLTGETPFDKQRLRSAAFDELLRIIRDEEPPKPSLKLSSSASLPTIAANRHIEPQKLSTLVRGELDWIVMKALEKDRSRRYETASAFAEDILHYLNDEAVTACPPSTTYKFRKFVRRNKTPLLISVGGAAALIVVTVASIFAALRFEKLAGDNAQLVTQKTELANNLKDALAESQQNLALAKTEQERAEGNFELALDALDAVYLQAIGEQKLLGRLPDEFGMSQSRATENGFSELEKELIRRGKGFYEQFAERNKNNPQADEQTAQAYYRIGLLQTGLRDWDEAKKSYRDAIQRFELLTAKEPDRGIHFRHLGNACYGLASIIVENDASKQESEKSLRAYSRAIELNPDDFQSYSMTGQVYKQLQRFKEMTAALEEAIRIKPDDVEARIQLGYGYASRGEYDKALDQLEEASRLSPEYYYPHAVKAYVYKEQKEYERAIEACNTAARLNPNAMLPYERRALIYSKLKNYDQVIADAGEAIRLHPDWAWWSYGLRAEAFLNKGDYEEAVRDCTQSLRINPVQYWPYANRVRALLELDRYDDAVADCKQMISINPHNYWAYWGLARADRARDFHEQAIRNYNKAIELEDPHRENADEIFRDRGGFYAELGRFDFAVADIRRAIELHPERKMNWWALLYVEFLRKSPVQTIRDLVMEAEASVGDSAFLFEHAVVTLALNQRDEYERICREGMRRLGESQKPEEQAALSRAIALTGDPQFDSKRLVLMARAAVEAESIPEYKHTLGLCLLRDGQPNEAIAWFHASLDQFWEGAAANHSGLAIAYAKSGNVEQAESEVKKVRESSKQDAVGEISRTVDPGFIESQILLKEADELMESMKMSENQ